jgi:hypothetical protein
MKALVYASNTTIKRLTPIFDNYLVEMQVLVRDDFKRFTHLVHWDDIDLVVVDTSEEGAGKVCNYFGREKRVPLALFVNRNQVDWAGLFCHGVYAYIPYETGERELAARLKKVLRSVGSELEVK